MLRFIYIIVLFLFGVSVYSAPVGTNFAGYPNTNVAPASSLLLIAVTNKVPRETYNIKVSDLTTQIVNQANALNLWTNDFDAAIGHYTRQVKGTTNSLKVLTNGLQGIAIGDVNIAASVQGWPFNGFTYISYLDGGTTPAHDYNAFAHGTIDSVGGGGDMLMEAVSNGGEKCTINLKTRTNNTTANAMELATKKAATYILATDSFGSPANAFGIQNTPISSTSAIIGETNLFRIVRNSSEVIAIHTNGNLTAAGMVISGGSHYPSNSTPVATIAAGMTNGAFWIGTLSNALQAAWMSNNVMNFKKLAP